MDMESSILPVAIAWLTKYEYLNGKGFSLLYRLIFVPCRHYLRINGGLAILVELVSAFLEKTLQ
jgi:hypothetical protein